MILDFGIFLQLGCLIGLLLLRVELTNSKSCKICVLQLIDIAKNSKKTNILHLSQGILYLSVGKAFHFRIHNNKLNANCLKAPVSVHPSDQGVWALICTLCTSSGNTSVINLIIVVILSYLLLACCLDFWAPS